MAALGLGLPRAASADPVRVIGLQFSDSGGVYAGWPTTCTVYLNTNPSGVNVGLDRTGPISSQAFVRVPGGQTFQSFLVYGDRTAQDTGATLTATYTDTYSNIPSSATANTTVHAITVSANAAAPALLVGQPNLLTISLNHALYSGGGVYVSGTHANRDYWGYISFPNGGSSLSFNVYGTGGLATITVMGDTVSSISGQATATFYATATTKAPNPGSPPGGRPGECLLCGNASLTGAVDLYSGNVALHHADPVATRGYPLTCNIHVNSQTVETDRAMGNARSRMTCT